MIPQVNIISRKASVASINKAGGTPGYSEPLSRRFRVLCPLRHFLGSKEHLVWLKTELNATTIITVRDFKCTKNPCGWKGTYTVLKVKSQASNI